MTLMILLLTGSFMGMLLWGLVHTLPRFAIEPPARLPKNPFAGLPFILPALTGALFVYAGWRMTEPAPQILFLTICCFLLLVALIDLHYRLVLNVLVYPAIVLMIVYHLLQPSALSMVLGGVLAGSIFGLTAWMRPGELGGGDVKLAALIGVLFGFPGVLWALLAGAGSGGVVAIGLLLHGGQKQRTIPYAPFLCGGALLVLLIQPTILLS